jgi:hypothetical protein
MIREGQNPPDVHLAQVALTALESSIKRRTIGQDGWPLKVSRSPSSSIAAASSPFRRPRHGADSDPTSAAGALPLLGVQVLNGSPCEDKET